MNKRKIFKQHYLLVVVGDSRANLGAGDVKPKTTLYSSTKNGKNSLKNFPSLHHIFKYSQWAKSPKKQSVISVFLTKTHSFDCFFGDLPTGKELKYD